MILIPTLYDEFIVRSKLSEQINPLQYIVPPPTSASEQLETIATELAFLDASIALFVGTLTIFKIKKCDYFSFAEMITKNSPRF